MLFTACNEKTTHPTHGEIVEAVYGLGTVESEELYLARFSIQVSVKEFYVTEGEDVKKGQKLFQIDEGNIIYSPINGRVTERPFHLKENVPPQSSIMTITNLDKVYLSVALEQHAAMKIKRGLKAEISFEFFRNKKVEGWIESFFPQKNEFIAKVKFKNTPEGILPGMTADVSIEVNRKTNALLVPAKAISNSHLTLIKKGKKERVEVEIGLSDLEKVEIISPALNDQDEILLP